MATQIDPWIHRSEGMRCATCMWFAPKGCLGRCRRHAPTMSGYPVVYPHDWCGDHKLDEAKASGGMKTTGMPSPTPNMNSHEPLGKQE